MPQPAGQKATTEHKYVMPGWEAYGEALDAVWPWSDRTAVRETLEELWPILRTDQAEAVATAMRAWGESAIVATWGPGERFTVVYQMAQNVINRGDPYDSGTLAHHIEGNGVSARTLRRWRERSPDGTRQYSDADIAALLQNRLDIADELVHKGAPSLGAARRRIQRRRRQ